MKDFDDKKFKDTIFNVDCNGLVEDETDICRQLVSQITDGRDFESIEPQPHVILSKDFLEFIKKYPVTAKPIMKKIMVNKIRKSEQDNFQKFRLDKINDLENDDAI